jgi:site-specific DNA-methyltransferase (adenine-specific)
MSDPYYQDDHVTIYHGDCRDLIDTLDFDVVVTDPPYGIEYEQTITETATWDKVSGDDSSELAEWVIAETHPIPMLVFGANHFPQALPVPGRWVCWDKRCDENADRMLGSPFELAWLNSEDKAGYMFRIQHGGVVNADNRKHRRQHPTQKPVLLMRRLLAEIPHLLATPDFADYSVVLDPFMGSGSTLRAAKDLGRHAIGIEIEERYCEIAAKRCAQEVLAFVPEGSDHAG